MPRDPDEELAIIEAPERAVTRYGKGKPMKALLLKKWGTNYAGQVLTNVEPGSIPESVAKFYEDDEPTPNDVVKDPSPEGTALSVTDDAMDEDEVQAASEAQVAKVASAKKQAEAAEVEAAEQAAEDEAAAKGTPKPKRKRRKR